MERPFIVNITAPDSSGAFTATVNHSSLQTATDYARNYFGDYRTDFRNQNVVEYLSSGAEQPFTDNHVFSVSKRTL